jgi:hypothetical protein
MSLPEYVFVRRGGITMEVRRGEAQRYIRMGYELVKDEPIPELDEPPVDLHDGKPQIGDEVSPSDPTPAVGEPPVYPLPEPTDSHEEAGFPEAPEEVIDIPLRGIASLSSDEAETLASLLDTQTHRELDTLAEEAQIEEWKANDNKSDKVALLAGSGRVYLGSDGMSIVTISPGDESSVEEGAGNGTT